MLERYQKLLAEKPAWWRLAGFVPNEEEPVHSWFFFKEGYAAELVRQLLPTLRARPGQMVLDPFCGSGTTLRVCAERGITSIGFDILPACLLASRVKTQRYDPQQLRAAAKELFARKFQKLDVGSVLPIMRRGFNRYTLEDVVFFRSAIASLPPQAREFFLLGLVNAAMKASYIWKDGGVLKMSRHPVPPFRRLFQMTAFCMIRDVQEAPPPAAEARVQEADARRLPLADASIDCVITSPPYLNNIDYTKVYAVENWLTGQPLPGLRSHVGLGRTPGETAVAGIALPPDAVAYFQDLEQVLAELARVCKPEARLALVIGNAFVQEQVIDCDLLLALLAERAGFRAKAILVVNKRFALEGRTRKRGVLRESIVLLEKARARNA